jgi:hypothetical protein
MRFILKLLPLVALFAFGAFTVGLPKAAQANLGTLTTSATTAAIGQPVTVTASLSNISGANVTLNATHSDFLAASVSTGEAINGIGTVTLSFTGAGSTVSTTFTALWSCEFTGPATIILQQNPAPTSGTGFLTTTVLCTDVATTALVVTPSTQTGGLPVAVTGTCATAGQLLTSVGGGVFTNYPAPSNITVGAPTTVSCIAPGIFSVSYVCGLDGIVTFSLTGVTATLTCSGGINPYVQNPVCPPIATYNGAYPYSGYNGSYPYNGNLPYSSSIYPTAGSLYNTLNGYTGYNGYNNGYNGYNNYANSACVTNVASTVTATTSSGSVSCGGTAFVTVVVRDASGAYVVNGQNVTLTSTMGTISPATSTTQGGSILATFTAPSSGSGTATIAVAAGVASTTATINVDCAPVVVQPVVAAPVAVAPVLIPPTQLITPPRTGDAGLVSSILCDE